MRARSLSRWRDVTVQKRSPPAALLVTVMWVALPDINCTDLSVSSQVAAGERALPKLPLYSAGVFWLFRNPSEDTMFAQSVFTYI
jgi:hypothetical protein